MLRIDSDQSNPINQVMFVSKNIALLRLWFGPRIISWAETGDQKTERTQRTIELV
jgi:hypothetical protein